MTKLKCSIISSKDFYLVMALAIKEWIRGYCGTLNRWSSTFCLLFVYMGCTNKRKISQQVAAAGPDRQVDMLINKKGTTAYLR